MPDQEQPPLTSIDLRPNLEAAPWTDVRPGYRNGMIESIGLVPNGTSTGRPSVALLVRTEDGGQVIAHTTWALLRTSVRGLDASPIAELDRQENP